ncbi:uncharacterized protein I206_106088 [Kwoniella pini CBS 10737]|uniref:Uncharacterized protein n=1 Tax=Kwoniella pini CBS 10737 TaxID=1296096 RepID=A0A1B9I128_9TREE|nr:uncharacterized protein I206_04912 [Kwoniella pini CBS 10737]OCF49224.1 hypothetical protein I206_04912 [Kwoniella pini CBS 10737]
MHRRHSSSDSFTSSSVPSRTSRHRTTDNVHRTRQLSTPNHDALVPGPSPSSLDRRGSASSSLGFIQSRPNMISSSPLASPTRPVAPSSSGSHRGVPNPLTSVTASGVSQIHRKKPVGYVSPVDDDLYDPYEAHPAAPVAERSDRQSLPPSQASASLEVGGQSSIVKQYVPPGFAEPTREVPWNREGPAMKTHGIAWLREGDPQELPTAPKGPRWEVARPPRPENVQGGSTWWESGSGGASYNV